MVDSHPGFEPTYINENHTTKLISSSREPSIPPITRWDVEWIDAASGILSTVSTLLKYLGDIDLFDAYRYWTASPVKHDGLIPNKDYFLNRH